MTISTRKFGLMFGVIAILAISAPVQAGKSYDRERPVSYKMSDYGVAPMSDVISRIHDDVGGMIVKVKLDAKKNPGDWKYKSKVLLPDGREVKIEHDAQSLDILKFKIKS